MPSVWLLHENLVRARNTDHAYGASRADLRIDLGFTVEPTLFDALDAFIAWHPITLAALDAVTLEALYTLVQTSRSDTDLREYILYPSAISLADTETMISPRKV